MNLANDNFPIYMSSPIGMIPAEHLTPMLLELAANAIFYMNTDMDSVTTSKVVAGIKDIILQDPSYKRMPLHLIIETFHKGSLGELGGTTKFGIRNVNIWLTSVKDKHQRLTMEEKSREDQKRKAEEEMAFKLQQKRSTLYGSAMMWKIGIAKQISSAEYDRLTLDRIVDAMQKGYDLKTLTPDAIL